MTNQTTSLLDKIKSRGYWHIVIRPEVFLKERITSLRDCQQLIENNQIRHRGWYFPHIDERDLHRGLDYIELNTEFRSTKESWRFYQSGQLAFFSALSEDWIADDTLMPNDYRQGIKPGLVLEVISALYQLAEAYEFVARLAQHGVYGRDFYLRINLVGVKGRQLFFWPGSGRYLSMAYVCQVIELPRENSYAVTDFIARSRDYTYSHFVWIMERFGFEPSEAVFKRDLEKFFEGRY
jgi:hypothetical protein